VVRTVFALVSCVALFVLGATGSLASQEDDVYRSYLRDFKAMDSLNDHRIEKYLSKRARTTWADAVAHPKMNCSPCPSPEQALKFAKELRPYPKPDLMPVKSTSGGVATLTFRWHEPPTSQGSFGANGLDAMIVVELVKEGVWKLKSESWSMAEKPGTGSFTGRSVWSY
jgi:hypothetical protein